MKALIFIFAASFVCRTAESCVQHSGTTKDARRITTGLSPAWILRSFLREDPQDKGRELEARYRSSSDPSFQEKNDHAAGLIFLGRSTEAIDFLKKLEQERPNEYSVAANLGTAYELAGQNENALHWIQESVRRNARSHNGTEWLHVKILEAKIGQQKNPDFFKSNSVLNIDHRQIDSVEDALMVGGERRTVQEITAAIDYQLRERLQFVKTPDPSVASLLVDRAMIEGAAHTLESALELLEMAANLGYPRDRIDPLVRQFNSTIRLGVFRQRLFYVAIAAAVVAFVAYALRRRWVVWSRAELPI